MLQTFCPHLLRPSIQSLLYRVRSAVRQNWSDDEGEQNHCAELTLGTQHKGGNDESTNETEVYRTGAIDKFGARALCPRKHILTEEPAECAIYGLDPISEARSGAIPEAGSLARPTAGAAACARPAALIATRRCSQRRGYANVYWNRSETSQEVRFKDIRNEHIRA